MAISKLCLLLLLVMRPVFSSNKKEVKCREDVKSINSVCTVDEFIANNFTSFKLHNDYNNNNIIISSLIFINSSINKITGKIFKQFKNLDTLDLSYCHVRELATNAFYNALKLTNLILPYNSLSQLNASQFYGAHSLNYINLSYNSIQTIDKAAFKNLNKLSILDLSFNRILILLNNVFASLNIVELHVNNNELEIFDLNMKNLKVLNLNNNRLHKVIVISKLEILTLRNNSMNNLEYFNNMTHLLYLDLSYNAFNYIEIAIDKIPDTETLDISMNNLTSIDFKSLSHLHHLKHLNLSGNQLNNQTFKDLKHILKNLLVVDISDNTWNCEKLQIVVNQLKENNISVIYNKMNDIDCTIITEIPNKENNNRDDHSLQNPIMMICVTMISIIFGVIIGCCIRKKCIEMRYGSNTVGLSYTQTNQEQETILEDSNH